jgi:creatinine amidohydrolase
MKRHFGIVTISCCLYSVLVLACTRQDAGSTRPAVAGGKVLTIGNLNWPDIDALNRDRTLLLLTVGMLEEHGPHLPIGTDTIGVEYEAEKVAERLSQALPDWNVVVMPTLHYGSSGANQVGGNIAIHPGTYGVRQSTLRSLIADVGGQIAQNRFKWLFVMNGHGAPTHHTAVNEACDFVSEIFNVTMLNVSGLFNADPAIRSQGEKVAAKHFSPADVASFGMDAHAGVGETSTVLALRPELVRPDYRSLPSYRAENVKEARSIGMKPGWPGYLSSPAMATAAYGRDIEAWWVEGMTDLILQAVRGQNLRNRPRFPENVQDDPAWIEVVEDVLEPEREFESKLQRWLAEREKK